MRTKSVLAAFVAATVMMSGCGSMGQSSGSSNLLGSAAGTGVSSLLGSMSGQGSSSSLGSTGTSMLGTLLSTLLGSKTSQSSIIGTWTYSKPKIAFESESILAQLGSTVVSNKLESALDTQLKKIGFVAGKTTFTFKSDGTCSMMVGTRSIPGTYTYNSSTGVMTMKGMFGMTSISPYVSVMGGEMYMLFETDKLLSLMTSISSSAKSSTFSNLLGNYNGLKLGWTMTRK